MTQLGFIPYHTIGVGDVTTTNARDGLRLKIGSFLGAAMLEVYNGTKLEKRRSSDLLE